MTDNLKRYVRKDTTMSILEAVINTMTMMVMSTFVAVTVGAEIVKTDKALIAS